MLEDGVSKEGISEPTRIDAAALMEFKKVPLSSKLDKGKGNAGPSSGAPASPRIWCLDDEEDMPFALGVTCPEPALPKRILKRSVSISEFGPW